MTRRFVDSLFTGGVILHRKFLAFAWSLVILCALVFELYPRSSQEIDLSTGAGISKMLRYENAQVYFFGEPIAAQNISNSAMHCSSTL